MGAKDDARGRRDNGLSARDYAVAGDVDPRVGEVLLDVLAVHGIGAYLRPTADLDPWMRVNQLPARPLDRLFVDRSRLHEARQLMASVREPTADPATAASRGGDGPQPEAGQTVAGRTELDYDREWARIIASFDVGPVGTEPAGSPPRRARRRDAEPDEPTLLDGLDTFGADLPEDEEDFVPPPAPPIPRPSGAAILAALGVFAGLLLIIKPSVVPAERPLAMATGLVCLAAGFGTLVWRLRPSRDEGDSDPDHGAQV